MTDEATKIGARNNAGDKQRIDESKAHAQAILDHMNAMNPAAEDMPNLAEHLGSQPMKATVIDLPTEILEWVTVKAGAEDWTLDVLGVPFGGPFNGKDRDKQYFDSQTKIMQHVYKTVPAFYGHGLTPEGVRDPNPEMIGLATYNRQDAQGHWYKIVLDKASKLASRIWEAAKKGKARASSGGLHNFVRDNKVTGHIDSWPVVEMTLVDIETSNLIPANPYAIAYPTMKAHYEKAGMELPSDNQPEATPPGDNTHAGAADKPTKLTEGVIEMDEKELEKFVADRIAAARLEDQQAAKAKSEADHIKAVEDENTALKAKLAEGNRLPGGMPHVTQFADTNKYDNLSAAELAIAIDVQNQFNASGKMPPASPAAIKALLLKVAHIENDKVSPETAMYAKAGARSAFGAELTDEAIKAATDPAYSTLSGFGSQWVGTAYSNQLWETIRATGRIVPRIPSVTIPDGYSSEYYPLEGADPTWYKVAETTAADSTMGVPVAKITASQMATDTKQITVAKMGARAMYSGELAEDSIIAYAAQLRRQLEVSGAEMMEHVVIDGDTATSSNVNDIGGTTYSGAATSLFLLTNGFRKSPLVTTTTQSLSAGGGFVAENFLNTVVLLGTNGIGYSDPTKCAFIVDPRTYFATATLPEAKDKNQTVFTVDGGFVTKAYMVDVIPSWFMHWRQTSRLANTAGKVDLDTAGNNLYGAIVAVRFDQWKLAYKRRMTMETTRFANSDSWEIVAMTRWGLGQKNTTASAETYYVGI